MSVKEEKAVVEKTTASTNEVKVENDTALINDVVTINSSNYVLSKRCPERLQYNGVVYSKNELLTNQEVFTSLVVGGSPFVKKI
jgi:hypothetical protein